MHAVKFLLAGLLTATFLASTSGRAAAQSALLGQEQQILAMTQDGWVHFRDYDGRQLIYFTHLEVYRCGIKEVRYSLNSKRLDRTWDLAPCDLENPHEIDAEAHLPFLSLDLGSAEWMAVQLTFTDGTQSAIVIETAK